MAGIFPDGGVSAGNAVNTLKNPLLDSSCKDRWHAPRCTPRFDPASANAIISEILNVMKCFGVAYDCDRLDNLCQAIQPHGISFFVNMPLDDNNQVIPSVTTGGGTMINDPIISRGSFVIPNTYHRTIRVQETFIYDMGLRQLIQGTDVTTRISLHDNADFSDSGITVYQDYFNYTPGINQTPTMSNKPTMVVDENIPAGGKTKYWKVEANSNQPNSWEIFPSRDPVTGGRFLAYGLYAETYDQ